MANIYTNYNKMADHLLHNYPFSICYIIIYIYYSTSQIILCLQKGPQDLSNYLLTTTVPSIVKVSIAIFYFYGRIVLRNSIL